MLQKQRRHLRLISAEASDPILFAHQLSRGANLITFLHL